MASLFVRRWLLLFVGVGIPATASTSHRHRMPGAKGVAGMLREIMGGSETRDTVQRWFFRQLPDIPIATRGPVTRTADGLYEQTYLTPALSLRPGEIGNKWMPIEWPHGHVVVNGFTADVVKAGPDGQIPPITPCCGGTHVARKEEVFMHHWTVNKWQLPRKMFEKLVDAGGLDYNVEEDWGQALEVMLADAGENTGADGPCSAGELHLYFGVGNEARGHASFEAPDPYGVVFDQTDMAKNGEFMVLSTHLIDTRGVEDVRSCTECNCAVLGVQPDKEGYQGGLACCHSTEIDGGRCASRTLTREPQNYYIRYTMRWRDWTADALPLEVITLDATDNNADWADLSAFDGGYPEMHSLQRIDNTSLEAVNDHRSGLHWTPGPEMKDLVKALRLDSNCHVEYFVPACRPGVDECLHRVQNSWRLPYPVDVVLIRNHLHDGGANMSTWNDKGDVCIGKSIYETVESSRWLVDVTTCKAAASAPLVVMHVNKGERISVEATYFQDDKPHFGVMALSFVYAHIPGSRSVVKKGSQNGIDDMVGFSATGPSREERMEQPKVADASHLSRSIRSTAMAAVSILLALTALAACRMLRCLHTSSVWASITWELVDRHAEVQAAHE